MVKVLLLDADGVSIIGGQRFSDRFVKDFGVAPAALDIFFKNDFNDCLMGRRDLKQALEPYLPQWGWTKSVDELLAYWFADGVIKNDPVLSLAQDLRGDGIMCYLTSNQDKYRGEYLWRTFGLFSYFDGNYFSANAGYTKRFPEFFMYLLGTIDDIRPEEILYWDDDEENVASAESVGINAHLFTDADEFREKTEDLVG